MRARLCCGAWAFAAWCAAGVCSAQTANIPDFRYRPAAPTKLKPGEPCSDCGRIVSIREVYVDRTSSIPATFKGSSRGQAGDNYVGAVVYLPLGSSASGKSYVGGVGTPEMRERFGSQTYDIAVRMDDGTMRSVRRSDGGLFEVGGRVRLGRDGVLEELAE